MQASDPINIVGFEVVVDGQKVTPSVQAKAVSLGVDVTALLQKYNLPLTLIMADDEAQKKFYDDLSRLPAPALAELQRYGVISVSDQGPGKPPDVNPQWTTNITFYWLQKFPAGKTIEITHKYRPVPRVFFTSVDELAKGDLHKNYCPNKAFLADAKFAEKAGALQGTELRYVLKTARNWSGPIGKFNLTIDKEDARLPITTCFDGLQAKSLTLLTATKENFSPDDDLDFLLLETIKSQ